MKSCKAWGRKGYDTSSMAAYECKKRECRNVKLPNICVHVERRLRIPSMQTGAQAPSLIPSAPTGARVRQDSIRVTDEIEKYPQEIDDSPYNPENINEMLDQYPLLPLQRAVMLWRLLTGLPFRDIGKALGVSSTYAHAQYREAEKIIRKAEGVKDE